MVTIEVTQKHIDEGEDCDQYRCAIAIAVGEQFPGKLVSVQLCAIAITSPVEEWKYTTQLIVRDFIARFDDGATVEPFTFTLPDFDLNGKPTPTPKER